MKRPRSHLNGNRARLGAENRHHVVKSSVEKLRRSPIFASISPAGQLAAACNEAYGTKRGNGELEGNPGDSRALDI